ncbi:UBX domain-containing protein 8-like [Nematostella vectensis]|uniref:UBX domain-containing protein 8-like n=1 Tax=Nematostella vectensis TaxID=45351 RepID=UPI00207764E2|nr:UBX domain-containing protein 8-like [Nematostella vectensis]
MALFATARDWIILGVVGAIIGGLFWSGLSVLTLKTILLWVLISFGFLTLLLHALGSPMTGLLAKFLKGEEKPKKTKFSKEELKREREMLLKEKQRLFDEKNLTFTEEVLNPRREARLQKREAELNRFSKWKGGHRFKNCQCGHPHEDEVDEPLLEQLDLADSASEEEETEKTQEVKADIEIPSANTLRKRRKKQVASSAHTKITEEQLAPEPDVGLAGVITVALRCPSGNTKKRRFTTSSKIQDLYQYAEFLGYSSSQYVIMSTYPRKPLNNQSVTFAEASLTQDVVLVIDEIDE